MTGEPGTMDGGRPELPRSGQDCLPARNVAEWKPDDRFSPCRHCRPDRAGCVCRGGAGACRPSARRACRDGKTGRYRARRARAATAGLGDRTQHRHPRRPARLHRDGGDLLAVRPVGRARGGDLLHRLSSPNRTTRDGRSPSSSTAVPAPARLFSTSAWSVRASPRSARTAATAPRCALSTIRTPGSPSPIWC